MIWARESFPASTSVTLKETTWLYNTDSKILSYYCIVLLFSGALDWCHALFPSHCHVFLFCVNTPFGIFTFGLASERPLVACKLTPLCRMSGYTGLQPKPSSHFWLHAPHPGTLSQINAVKGVILTHPLGESLFWRSQRPGPRVHDWWCALFYCRCGMSAIPTKAQCWFLE